MSMTRAARFLCRYLVRHPLYVGVYAYGYFRSSLTLDTKFHSKEQLREQLVRGKSLIRIGDGEINLLLDIENVYHRPSVQLKQMIRSVIERYSEESPYVLSVPRFVNTPNKELKKEGKLNVWLPLKIMFLLIFPGKMAYMDAHNFYYDQYFEENIAPVFLDKNIVLITNKETIAFQRTNLHLPWTSMSFVETPTENALASVESIRRDIDEAIRSSGIGTVALFFAMGPVGKYLIAEYAARGVQSVDIGKVAEVMFTGETISYLV